MNITRVQILPNCLLLTISTKCFFSIVSVFINHPNSLSNVLLLLIEFRNLKSLSPARSSIWLWRFDIFIAYDIHIGFCSYIPKIWIQQVGIEVHKSNKKPFTVWINLLCLYFRDVKLYCRCLKRIAWLIALLLSALIIASRKHYSVDVVVAW